MDDKVTIRNGKKFRNRVDVIATVNGGQGVLCCLRGWNNRVEFPGGGVGKGEDIYSAARRESMEESGWVCKNFIYTKATCNHGVYEGTDSEWLRSLGYDGEIQYTVFATPVEFNPSSIYRSEGDGKHFDIHPIEVAMNQILKDIEDYKKGELNSHLYTQAQHRLECLLVAFPHLNSFVNASIPGVIQKW